MVSPARMLVWEQYPSIQGQRYLIAGSTWVLVRSHSSVPGREFSRAMRLVERLVDRERGRLLQPARAAVAPRPARDWRSSRRFRPEFSAEESMGEERLGRDDGT